MLPPRQAPMGGPRPLPSQPVRPRNRRGPARPQGIARRHHVLAGGRPGGGQRRDQRRVSRAGRGARERRRRRHPRRSRWPKG